MIVTSFISLLKNKLKNAIETYSINYAIPFTLWDDPYVYEIMDDPYKITTNFDSDKDYLAHSTHKIISHPLFKDFANNTLYNMKLTIFQHKITVIPININDNEIENLSSILNMFQVIHHKKLTQIKSTIKINGKLFMRPDREYWINILNDYEYVVHCYPIDEKGERKSMLYYMFKPVNQSYQDHSIHFSF